VWPSSQQNKKDVMIPTIRGNETLVRWRDNHGWQFQKNGVMYTLWENPQFDVSLFSEIDVAMSWLEKLEDEINLHVQNFLEGLCEWTGEKELVTIDVSWLVSKKQIDAQYANDDWGALGINIVVTDGRIVNSYSGDA